MKKGTIKEIFQEHFEHFWEENEGKFPKDEREHIREEVEKMMHCGNRCHPESCVKVERRRDREERQWNKEASRGCTDKSLFDLELSVL